MAKKKQLIVDPVTSKLSRLNSKDLPLIGITGLDSGDPVAPFGVLESDIIEYCIYDTSDNYMASGEIGYPLPTNLDVGEHVRSLGFERGTYKIVYNFLRQIGGSNKIVLVKKSDKTIYKEEYFINTDGKIYAGTSEVPIVDNDGNQIELLVQEDKFWLQEISPSRTEIRLRPNPGIDDLDYYEQFRLLGYTCLSYSDVSGESYITFSTDGKTATLNGSSISLSEAMKDGTLKIRDAFVLDYEGGPEEITRHTPVIETEQLPPSKNLITNGHFKDGLDVSERTNLNDWPTNEIVEFPNPGHSKYCLRMTSVGGSPSNQYRMRTDGLIPGESYIASCWVMWTEDWDSLTDQGIIFIKKADDTNILNYPTHGIVSDEKVIMDPSGTSQVWKRVHGNFTAEEDRIQWVLGYNNGSHRNLPDGSLEAGLGNRAGYRYFTDIQLEPGSITGVPTPYMLEERVEETEVPSTGLITFVGDGGLVKATFADEDSGFTELMAADDGRGSGKLTIKDAYVLDEVYGDNPGVTIIDDIPIANSSAGQIRENGYESEFLKSPYHGDPGDEEGLLIIRLQVDWQYKLEHLDADNNVISTIQPNFKSNWKKSKQHMITGFGETDKLRLESHNIGRKAGLLAQIRFFHYTIQNYRTGDPGSDQVFPDGSTVASNNPGVWNVVSEDGVTYVGDVDYIHDYKTDGDHSFWKKKWIHNDLEDCGWIWVEEQKNNQTVIWEWQPIPVVDEIWKFWDPNLHSDAVHPEGWASGFNAHHGNPSGRGYNSGWIGYHAKWVPGDGQFGETCMKFIDKNSEFEYPNHIDYNGVYKTGDYSGNSSTGMDHRWLGISQKLPHTMASQGIEAGDEIKITWWQKTDTEGKGANVGLYHYLKSSGGQDFGEFLQFIPCSKVGEWEQVSYISIVDDDWDLSKVTRLYVYGHYGPEGILWAENVQLEVVSTSNEINTVPVMADFVGPIGSVYDKNTLSISGGGYEQWAPDGYIPNNDANIYSYNTFTEFYVDYTASISTLEATYGSFRGDIESISGNSITLKNSYSELGESLDHDFENELGINQNSQFNNWFIQYPADNSEDLSKLVRLGPDNYSLITNFKIDTTTYNEYPYSVAYKLYEPLLDEVQEHDFVNIVKEMIPPVEETCTLIPFVEEEITDIVLRTPEFANTNSPIGAGQTEFKNYNQLTTTDADIKSKLEDELLSGSLSADINIDHSQFSNFVHFGSVEKRLRNFKYKLDLIEQYTDRSASLSGAGSGSTGRIGIVADPAAGSYLNVSGSTSLNPPYTPVSGSLTQIQWWERQRRETINNFDKFEKYMFNQSSSYSSQSIGVFNDNAWPKRGGSGSYSYPYVLARTSQSIATTWYANQLVSASAYDKANKNRVRSHLPMFVQDDTENNVFLNFVDMIGHYFDDIWVFIKAITDVHDKRDKLTEGISKDLLHNVAQSLGWEVYNGKDLISLPRYIFGMEQTGSETPWQYSGTSDRDISREVWSRIINNMPYFLKSKGTSRAIKGLISCYGIPSSILRVIEYGGPKLPGQPPDFLLTRKFTKALDFFGASNNTYVQNETWQPVTLGDAPTSRHPDTVEFRFKTVTGSNQVLVRRGDDWAIRLKDNGSTDRYGYISFMLSGSNGYNEISSSEFPVYDGEFWSVMLTRTSASGYHLADNSISQDVVYSLYTKKYDAGRSKIIYESTSTLVASGSLGTVSQSYNASYTGSGTTVTIGGPEENTYFGESLSGSMMEYRNWTTPLIESSFDNHVASPISFDGNTPSASYLDLVTRYSFDDNKDLSVGANQWFQDASADQSFTSSAVPSGYTSGMGNHFSSVVDENKMKVPNLGPSRRSSNKIRIEDDELIDSADYLNPKLKFRESITIPAYDNASIDSNKLGIYFSPSAVIDEDIIQSMPNLDFDQYIGDPRDQYKEQYTGLVTARNLYWQKYSGPNNFWDYLRLLKYYDSSLYKQLRDLVPARANANIGILIEPTILERDKIIIGKEPEFEPQHHTTFIDTMAYISESSNYPNWETSLNYSNEFWPGPYQKTGSYVSASSNYPNYEVSFNYTDPFRVNFHTNESGSYISASAGYEDLPTSINLHDPFLVNSHTQLTGSGVSMSADFNYYTAPTNTFSEIAAGTGSFVGKEFLERPALYNIGDRDYSGWYGSDYYNASIQEGSQKSIYEEVVMPRVRNNVFSELNREEEFFYSSSLSASLHKPYSSSFVLSDFDNRWDESTGTERLFYLGCVQDDDSTEDKTPAVEVTFTTPTKITTGTNPNSRLNVVNKGFQPK